MSNKDDGNFNLYNKVLNSNLSISKNNISFKQLNKHEIEFNEKEKESQKAFHCHSLTLMDDVIKNMHKKWSYID